ncbi:Protein FAM69A [Stylophora pistillata]|uniref:Protein FAM69A n=1 Tax=Stylophora pistillata TaxID=50429 RepID=A0A2B4S1R9_STYPI|nr:Protein FAM69A [Stylophora pistillata]
MKHSSYSLQTKCSAYKAGHVSGPLCPDLCSSQSIFHLGNCLSTVPDKKIYNGEWQGEKVIFKINMSWFEEFERRQIIADISVVSSYQEDVSSRVKALFGDCSHCNKLVSRLLLLGDGDGDKTISASEGRTFISLLQLVEPMMLMVLNESKHTVDFFGYCGGLYAVEEVSFVASDVFGDTWELTELSLFPDVFEPKQKVFNDLSSRAMKFVGSSLLKMAGNFGYASTVAKCPIISAFFHVYINSIRKKFDFAYSLLDATLDVSTSRYGLTQLCDVHLGNYGITTTSTVKLLDLDLMYPHVFLRTLLEQKKCVSDWDCFVGRFDFCWSTCDKTKGTCKSLLGIQDLHMVCEGVFPQLFKSPNYLEPTGHNMTCLERVMRKLAVFCSKIPVVYSSEELQRNILTVKKRLKSVYVMVANEC